MDPPRKNWRQVSLRGALVSMAFLGAIAAVARLSWWSEPLFAAFLLAGCLLLLGGAIGALFGRTFAGLAVAYLCLGWTLIGGVVLFVVVAIFVSIFV